MRLRVLLILGSGLLVNCGGEDPAVALCVQEAANRLPGQDNRLDEKALASSRTEEADGNVTYTGPLLLKPGTGAEQKQQFVCKVAPATADSPPRILNVKFDMEGTGIYSK